VETLTDADADRADGRGSAVDASRDASASVDDWLATLAANPPFDELLSVPEPERRARGYGDTLREICQQPLELTSAKPQPLRRQTDRQHSVDHGPAPS